MTICNTSKIIGSRRAILLLGLTLITPFMVGCGPKSRISNDPFRRTSGPATIPDDPRYDAGSTFDRANDAARQRDVSSDVSTSPAAQPRLAETGDSGRFLAASQNKPAARGNDPFLNPADMPAVAPPKLDGDAALTGPALGSKFEQYETVRQRLDKVGAHNFHFDQDPATGETVFTCELPYPDNPTLFRVFEARSPDESKAMQAVTEQVERWVAERKR